jgi:hypothetical protein
MSRLRLHSATLALLALSCTSALKAESVVTSQQQTIQAPIIAPSDMGTAAGTTPAMVALPVDNSSVGVGSTKKWYTFSAALREIYDDNVNTTSTNKQASFETQFNPSVLVDFPSANGDILASYSLGITYYNNPNSNNGTGRNGGGNYHTDSVTYSNSLLAQYSHTFSERFSLSAAENLNYDQQPNILQSTGTNYQNGQYITSNFNANLSAQWTPLVGTTTTYANTIVAYEDSSVADTQDSIENTASQSISFSVLPKINVNAGAIVDDDSYRTASRGYTSYTGFGGLGWTALPSLSISGRAGASYTQTDQSQPGTSSGSFSPYAALSMSWALGAKSSLSFDYEHEITPSDELNSNGQTSDRVSANFSYQIASSISTHVSGVYTLANVTSSLLTSSSMNSYTEQSYGLDTGLTYHYNSFLNLDADLNVSGVSSPINGRDYDRGQASFGIRGTY